MSNEQPTPLELAEWLEDQYDPTLWIEMSAAELRRLHAANSALEAALSQIVELWDRYVPDDCVSELHTNARDALKIAKGEE